ncbi:MAG TPA: type VI secretion system protein TssA [Polyangiaceae bacterium]|jgi:type VI secretion system protein ImpA|nr:type VI secretion system protein TssA [Polyangiaceae bacterium]
MTIALLTFEGSLESGLEASMGSGLERLLEPVSESKPAGDNLEYQPEFAELERAAQGKPARQMGSAVAPGEPPNFARVVELAGALLQRSKDLRIAVQLARALLETRGLAGLVAGLRLTRGLLERYWDALYPELDPDDPDAMMRRAALSALSAPELVSAVRAAPLLESPRFGPISLRDVAIATGELQHPPRHADLDADVVAGCFRSAAPGVLQALLDQVEAARSHVKAIEALLAASAGGAPADFRNLDRVLYQAGALVRPQLEQQRGEAQGEEREGAPADTVPPISGARAVAGASGVGTGIRSREDVILALEQICEYYAQYEPSSPLPLILQRCRRLVSSSFLEIVRDLAPDALAQIQAITGKTED